YRGPRPDRADRSVAKRARGSPPRLLLRRDAIAKGADALGAQLDQRTRPELSRGIRAVAERAEREGVPARKESFARDIGDQVEQAGGGAVQVPLLDLLAVDPHLDEHRLRVHVVGG